MLFFNHIRNKYSLIANSFFFLFLNLATTMRVWVAGAVSVNLSDQKAWQGHVDTHSHKKTHMFTLSF